MLGHKPNQAIWARINEVIMGENGAEVLVTLISGMCGIVMAAEASPNETDARVRLAAMLLSPDDGPVGSLVPLLQAELALLEDGTWRH